MQRTSESPVRININMNIIPHPRTSINLADTIEEIDEAERAREAAVHFRALAAKYNNPRWIREAGKQQAIADAIDAKYDTNALRRAS